MIELAAPIVFFVAPNGVGKSSMVEAARWGLLGQPDARKMKTAVRSGASEAVVTIELEVEAGGSLIELTRTLTSSGRESFSALRDGADLAQSDFDLVLRQGWGADRSLIDRLMFIDPGLAPSKSAFPVRDHLAAVLGVTPLVESAAQLGLAHKASDDQIEALRGSLRSADQELASSEESEATADVDLSTLVERREDLERRINQAESQREDSALWTGYRNEIQRHNAELAGIVSELSETMAVDSSDPTASLEAERTNQERTIVRERAAISEFDVRQARSLNASEVLAAASDECPTCLRPLADHERNTALDRHSSTVSAVQADASTERERLTAHEERKATLDAFTTRLLRLRPPASPSIPDPGELAASDVDRLRSDLADVTEAIGRSRAQLEVATNRQELVARIDEVRDQLNSAASEEQLLTTMGEVLDAWGDKILKERLDPLITDLSHRWKLLFGTGGLTLQPSGELVLRSNGTQLGLADLSSGERATALLITRLLVTAAATSIPTLFFDEPLESLDPRRRASVAQLLVRAAQTRTVKQIVVTTYEERIVRQLARSDPDNVQVVYADAPLTR